MKKRCTFYPLYIVQYYNCTLVFRCFVQSFSFFGCQCYILLMDHRRIVSHFVLELIFVFQKYAR